jgi:serine/threonine protein kinase
VQDLLLYDPQQRPTASQVLQYPFFQVNNSIPPPMSTAETIPSSFTKRPIQKSEADIKADERMLAKKVRGYIICYYFTI